MGSGGKLKKLVKLAALGAIVGLIVKRKQSEKAPEGTWKDVSTASKS